MVMTIASEEAEFYISLDENQISGLYHIYIYTKRLPILPGEVIVSRVGAEKIYHGLKHNVMPESKLSAQKTRMNTQMPTRKSFPGQNWNILKKQSK